MLNWRYKWIKLEEKHQQVMEGLEPFVPKMIRVDDHRVCPLHGYKFDMKTGRSVDGNNYQLKTYKFDLRNDGWYIGIKKF